ncbi:unnamed protein product [Effrenium voratum]|uniref:Alcohol dehydrogenase-like N-terminal domain-containing protein n=1 Tax=Effrenium voratum TaxID=2562239 RepID=A0AA36HS92_9DINO|nr:unnamed protein product [Effrenium voratum]
MSERGLQVIRGSPPRASIVRLTRSTAPSPEEVLVRVQAAALAATDVQLCHRSFTSEPSTFIPGVFFTGKVLTLGRSVRGLRVGELVLGIAKTEGDEPGGCYRETVCAHFSTLLPLEGLVEAKLQPATVLAHVPPMISALTCIASHLRLQPSQAFLLIAPRLNDVIFILQRLLISESWQGPLYLLLLTGPALRREDLERHVALQPLLSGGVLEGSKNFLHDMMGFSVEEHMDSFASSEAVLEELVAKVAWKDRQVDTADLDAACVALEPVAKRRALLRSMVSALALGGRLVTNRGLEISPAEGQHLWVKECSVSFFNPHCMPLSMLRHGELLHAAAEVCGRIAAGELCVTDSEVAQFYLFDQFQQALDVASREQGGRKFASGPELVTLLL